MSNIDFTQRITAAEAAASRLQAARAQALGSLAAWIADKAAAATGSAPLAERLAWASKEAAARAFLEGTATQDQSDMITAESNVTGESAQDLAEKILRNASETRRLSALLAGLRRRIAQSLQGAQTPEAVAAALSQGLREGETALAARR